MAECLNGAHDAPEVMTGVVQLILESLQRIEREHGVRILYACESGSRGWGFESLDSDYDVRFLYAHPRDWYLSVTERRDVIELPPDGVLDINGWDLRKALRLLRKSNPTLLEWLQSPIVYRDDKQTIDALRSLAVRYYAPRTCLQHYLHMAKGNYREYLHGDQVWLKKYLYVLRPVLACRWIEAGHGQAPMQLASLVAACVENLALRAAIAALLAQKRAGAELDRGPRVPVISEFLQSEIARLEALPAPAHAERPDDEELDEAFRRLLSVA